ncbi:MAG TPA: hypothetical protein DIT43_04405 [Dehalococcoidia bacterium]|nr:hypothetical protein [Dehalococcoidia bacterium]
MGALAWILYFFAFLCTIMGIITVTGVVPVFANLTGQIWLILGAIFFLSSIPGFIVQGRYEE